MVSVTPTAIPEVKLVEPVRHGDARGYFVESWSRREFAKHGLDLDFVQDNMALSEAPGTVRGLHLQVAPAALGKLVSALRGAILDVAVDIRAGSSSFGRHVAIEISAENGRQLWVPPGFAHGYCTLEPDTLVFYKQTGHYAPEHERGVRWDDPALDLPWPVTSAEAVVSDKDRRLPTLADFGSV